MEIHTTKSLLRPWRHEDKPALIEFGNNRNVWRNLTHMFPYPFTEKDADQWFTFVETTPNSLHLAIEVDGKAIGGIGAMLGQGIFCKTAEFGYWIGEPYWGRGILSEAAPAFVKHIMFTWQLHRVQAYVLAWNPVSMRILEKAGLHKEAVLRRSVIKDGEVVDEILFALTDQ